MRDDPKNGCVADYLRYDVERLLWILYIVTANCLSLTFSSLSQPSSSNKTLERTVAVFRPKWPKYHTLWGGTYLYGLYKGVPPPPPPEYARNKYWPAGGEGVLIFVVT